MASSSSVSVFDNHRFKSAFDEELYNTIMKNKKIALRGWRRLAAPKPKVSETLIHEFYANAIITEEEIEEHGGHSYKSFVRDVLVNFSPEKIRARYSLRLRSEIPVIRAILIHCIMNGEDVHAEEIIADKMVRMEQGIKEKGKLGFPSTIYKLCKEAGVPLREFRRTNHSKENGINQPQDNEDEDQQMPQAEEGHGEEQGEEHDYQHHQPEYDHEPQFQQSPLYEIPTYIDQHEKDLHSIEEQLQNMMRL
ncbi:hypothetical protein PIB30_083729 [Stylosanthes scabra]|uniref:Uncharacterized protein n=1 Tax=Stylosanthes scabra TaxID=79078 RepID=A0ABU6TRU8_9FABA|nr:hypothetical protein [Stylosanthes scabra]